MASLTFTLTRTDPSNLVSNFYLPLKLYGELEAALRDFSTYNSIPNVNVGKNHYFSVQIANVLNIIEFPTAFYEINDIN